MSFCATNPKWNWIRKTGGESPRMSNFEQRRVAGAHTLLCSQISAKRAVMPMLMIRCPRTGCDVTTGLEVDHLSLEKLPDVMVHTHCPHCRIDHSWWPEEAWLADRPMPPSERLVDELSTYAVPWLRRRAQ